MQQCCPTQIFYIKCTLLYSTKYTVYLHGCVIPFWEYYFINLISNSYILENKHIITGDKHLYSYPSTLFNKHCHWEAPLLIINYILITSTVPITKLCTLLMNQFLLCEHKLPSINLRKYQIMYILQVQNHFSRLYAKCQPLWSLSSMVFRGD